MKKLLLLFAIALIAATVRSQPCPNAGFGFSGVCFDDSTVVTDMSTDSIATIVSWEWNFGDGNLSSLQNPSH